MADYDFSTLNDKDFENLVRDILNQEYKSKGMIFQSFKKGSDGGIDLRYSVNNNENKIIVQAKHYYESPKSKLISDLKKEAKKVKDLNPENYFLFTSKGLLPNDKIKIKKLFSPYIRSTNKIFGKDDINGLINKYPVIEEQNIKLWFSSLQILKTILASEITGRAKYLKSEIQDKVSIYVETNMHEKAFKVLVDNKILILTGQPGVGKTTMAQMLLWKMMSKGAQLIQIFENIEEAEKSLDNDSHQVFYFDDFLGSNYIDMLRNNKDSKLIYFINRVKNTKNKHFILTTRITLFNQAKLFSEKIKRENFEIYESQINLKNYTIRDKGKILYNHLYFNNIPSYLLEEIVFEKNYWKIIKHKNYNPRLIEFFTNENRLKGIKKGEYLDFIIDNLENPSEVWAHSYNQQISDDERFLLCSLATLKGKSSISRLKKIFNSRLNFEIKENGYQKTHNTFNKSLKKLNDSWLVSYDLYGQLEIKFINPSAYDFIIKFLSIHLEEQWRLVSSLTHYDQFEIFSKSNKQKVIIDDYKSKEIVKLLSEQSFLYFNHYSNPKRDEGLLNKCYLLIELTLKENHQKALYLLFKSLEDYPSLEYAMHVLKYSCEQNIINIIEFVNREWDHIITLLLQNCADEDSLYHIYNLFDLFDQDYSYFINNPINRGEVAEVLTNLMHDKVYNVIENRKDEIFNEIDQDYLKDEIIDYIKELFKNFDIIDEVEIELNAFYDIDWVDQINQNNTWQARKDIKEEMIDHTQFDDDHNDNEYVDNLFD